MTEEKEYYGFIYLTTNNIDNKKYIGQKNYDSQGKWKRYLGSGIHLKRAIDKYGRENFSREIIEECKTKEELDRREIYWINTYNAVKDDNFYNIAHGGDGGYTLEGIDENQRKEIIKKRGKTIKQVCKKGEDSNLSKLTEENVLHIIERLLKNEFCSDIAKDYDISVETIYNIRDHKSWNHLTNELQFNKNSEHSRSCTTKKAVYQYDLDGNYIAEYESAAEAGRHVGIHSSKIGSVCSGKRKTAKKYIWSHEKYNNIFLKNYS